MPWWSFQILSPLPPSGQPKNIQEHRVNEGLWEKKKPSSENVLQNLVSFPTVEVNVEHKCLLLTFIKIPSFFFSIKIQFVRFVTRVE